MSGEGLKDREVGYGRPPKATRFAPGRSGNPRGRPPGVKSLSDIVRRIVGQKVTVTETGARGVYPDWRRSSCALPARRHVAIRGPCACCYN
jgi:Family of unknown function (DUF5681)